MFIPTHINIAGNLLLLYCCFTAALLEKIVAEKAPLKKEFNVYIIIIIISLLQALTPQIQYAYVCML
jgi:hypothetical protein